MYAITEWNLQVRRSTLTSNNNVRFTVRVGILSCVHCGDGKASLGPIHVLSGLKAQTNITDPFTTKEKHSCLHLCFSAKGASEKAEMHIEMAISRKPRAGIYQPKFVQKIGPLS